MTDDELTDAWEAGALFPGGVSHVQHFRIAWILHRRHGPDRAKGRLIDGTRRACDVHGCSEKFDAALTERWADALATEINRGGLEANADAFLAAHPELQRGDLLSDSQRRRPVQA